ncbi:MAG: hydroxyethylthiazole kinase [Proteobacteria bacterium]|nr:hydroxyethylthiazole kinase [Pseudomonadota bacterium]
MSPLHTQERLQQDIAEAATQVRARHPLAGSITNAVTVDFVANAQLAAGGAPAMVYLPDEGEFLASVGGATYINMGTLLPIHAETLPRTVRSLAAQGKPWVLDPVAIGIGALRQELLVDFKDYPPCVVRGNATEIIALAHLWQLDTDAAKANLRGVDAHNAVTEARGAAVALARHTRGAVAVSGEVDLVTDSACVLHCYGGSHFMEKVTGFGCSLGGVVAVYASCSEPLVAALAATQLYNLAGQRAAAVAQGPGSFQVAFLDAVYNAQPAEIAAVPFDIEDA